MPVKRRVAKRRLTQEAELQAWRDTFSTGYDFFGDLADIGVVHPVGARIPIAEREAVEEKFYAAAADAWKRLGALFLQGWEQSQKEPWALQKFGAPQCR